MPPETEFEKCAMMVLRLQNQHFQAKVDLRLARIDQLAQLGRDRLAKLDELIQQDQLEEQLAQLERDFLAERDAVIQRFQQAKEKQFEEHEAEMRTLEATCLDSGFKLSDLHNSIYCFWD